MPRQIISDIGCSAKTCYDEKGNKCGWLWVDDDLKNCDLFGTALDTISDIDKTPIRCQQCKEGELLLNKLRFKKR